MKKLLLLATVLQLRAMESESQVELLRDLCIKAVAHYLIKGPEKLLTRIHKRTSQDNITAALDVLPLECVYRLAAHVPIISRPDLKDLQDINDNDGVICKNNKFFRISDPSHPMDSSDRPCRGIKLSSDAKYWIERMWNPMERNKLWICSSTSKNFLSDFAGEDFCVTQDKIYYENHDVLCEYDLIKNHKHATYFKIAEVIAFLSASKRLFFRKYRSDNEYGLVDCERSAIDFYFKISPVSYKNVGINDTLPSKILATRSLSSTYELLAATGPEYGKLTIYKLENSLKPLMIVDDPQIAVNSACFDPSGKYIAVGADMNDHSISIYDIGAQQRIAYTQIPKFPITKIWWLTTCLYFKDGAGRVYEGDSNLLFKIREYLQNKGKV